LTLDGLERFDVALFRLINDGWHTPALDTFYLFLSRPPYRATLFALLIGLLCWTGRRRGREATLVVIVAVALADQLSSNLLKDLFDRVRPCFALEDVRLLWPRQSHSPSFPSGHAANSAAAATVLWRVGGVWRWSALVAAVLIAYSRIYIGVHYPLDAVGGLVVGGACGLAANFLWIRLSQGRRKPPGQQPERAETLQIRPTAAENPKRWQKWWARLFPTRAGSWHGCSRATARTVGCSTTSSASSPPAWES